MEKEIKLGFKVGFALWQIYALYISGMAIGIFFLGGNPVVYGLTGFFGGIMCILFTQHYFEWSLIKIKKQIKSRHRETG